MEKLSKPDRGSKTLLAKSRNTIYKKISSSKRSSSSFLNSLGDAGFFAGRFLKEVFKLKITGKEFLRQCYESGNKSLPLVAITGFIMGMVLTIQSRPVLVEFGAETWLPGMVSLSLLREMGPVITALIFAGKVGSGIGAELGSMKVTEQIDAMEVSGADPFNYLVVTRVLATAMMVPLLVIFADTMGLIGSYLGANIKGDVNLFLFFSRAFENVNFGDLIPATIKSFFFGAAIGLVSCYKGYNAASGTESVGAAANGSVVISSLMIFIVDAVSVQVTDLFIAK